jgi:hypothetical protein
MSADVRVSPEAEHGDEFEHVDAEDGDEETGGDRGDTAVGGVWITAALAEEAEFYVFVKHDVKHA